MSDSHTDKFSKFEALGRTRFVLLYGVLGWGVPTAILFSLIQGYLHGFDGFLFKLIPALVLFPIGGIFFGRYMWKVQERLHRKAAGLSVEG